ncbi:MAG: hypothetical protein IPJ13_05035 [Saprospiraceae bacterium]|nr:hypothetical protein [Saprospiraceae bacterium]
MMKSKRSQVRNFTILQEKLVYIGQLDCYERGSEIANMLLNIKTNDTAIYRITDKIGELSLKITEEEEFRDPIQLSEGEHLYVQSDGICCYLERRKLEAKLGRIFKSGEIYKENETRNWIKSRVYRYFGFSCEI